MKVIIPVAGTGTRLKPHTLTLPKPLLRMGGRAILDYLLMPITGLEPEEEGREPHLSLGGIWFAERAP